jgi:hypothetical protein
LQPKGSGDDVWSRLPDDLSKAICEAEVKTSQWTLMHRQVEQWHSHHHALMFQTHASTLASTMT